MTRVIRAPDGAAWTVSRVEAPWHLRHRVSLEPDLVGVLLWLAAWPLLLGESLLWLAGWAVLRIRHRLGLPWIIEARTEGPPDRLLRWSALGSSASRDRVREIATDLAQGRDIAATASTRAVGDRALRG